MKEARARILSTNMFQKMQPARFIYPWAHSLASLLLRPGSASHALKNFFPLQEMTRCEHSYSFFPTTILSCHQPMTHSGHWEMVTSGRRIPSFPCTPLQDRVAGLFCGRWRVIPAISPMCQMVRCWQMSFHPMRTFGWQVPSL